MTKDPRQIPVQFNIKIPYSFKEFLMDKASADRTSQNQLAMDALMGAYGDEYKAYEQYMAREDATS